LNIVTGATGIIGSHVVLAMLQNNRPVLAARQKSSDLKKVEKLFSYYTSDHKQLFEKIKWIDLDVRDVFSIEEALSGVDHVYHCAGFVSFDGKDRKKLFEVNEGGTKNMVDACLHKKVKALCHVSSVATINNLDYASDLTEDVFWKTSGRESDYAISKYNAEREVWRGMEEGLQAVIVNPGVVLSPGFWDQSSSQLFKTCFAGNRFYTNGLASYVAATDVARAMLELMDARLFSQRYILTENNYTFHNILSHVQARFGKAEPSINASEGMLQLAGFLERFFSFFTGKQVKLSKPVIQAAQSKQIFSNKKIRSALGFEFRPTHTVIEQICDYYLQER
jgi:dihydroflavonol-4-reductase